MSETAKTDESSSKNIYGDPPKINISLPEINELTQNSKPSKDVQLPIDILLLTVKDCEFFKAVTITLLVHSEAILKGLVMYTLGALVETRMLN